MTHDVSNQAPFPEVDVAADDALLEGARREGAGWDQPKLHRLGVLAGSRQATEWGRLANEYPPVLRTHDGYGHRIDEVEYHPAWHDLMKVAVAHRLHAAPWAEHRPGVHVARAARFLVWFQAEAGHTCPISMTYACVPALRAAPDQATWLEPLLTSTRYDPGLRDPATKSGLLAGMSMTEKQGGSDVRANTTTAVPAPDGTYRLTGHKWFTSAPMCDVFLTLAQAPQGLSCFLLPRVLADGSCNRIRLQRLKDKLGNRSNASAELEYDGAVGWPVGEEGRGVRTIIEMVNLTRLDCVLGAAAGMRYGTVRALWHAAHRSAFGHALVDQPLMRNVLADLAVESEAATALALRLAGAIDRAVEGDAGEGELARIGVAAGKYWVCKRGPWHAAEALECLGGNGYVEESGMPRLYRELPLLSIWEGSGNVAALDVVRALVRSPHTRDALLAEVEPARGADPRFDAALADLLAMLDDVVPDGASPQDYLARRLAERMTLVLQGSLLIRHAPHAVADAFCATRLAGDHGGAFGTLPAGLAVQALIERAMPRPV